MEKSNLSKRDLEIILESLKYTKYNFENYQKYPSQEYKLKRIEDVSEVISKIQALKKAAI